MPRGKQIDLPDTIQRSDKHAQEIYQETLQSAHETYEGDEERAHRVAYAALKHQYKKSGDRWVKKDSQGRSDTQAARVDDEGRTKDELYDRAKELDIPGRSKMNKEELAVAVQEGKSR